MLTSQEYNTIKQVHKDAKFLVSKMLADIDLIEKNKHIISSYIDSWDTWHRKVFAINVPELINNLMQLKPVLNEIQINLSLLDNINSDIADEFKDFILSDFVNCGWKMTTLCGYNKGPAFIDFLKTSGTMENEGLSSIHHILSTLYSSYSFKIKSLQNKFSTLYIFDKIKNISGNILIIGANGSGKSSLARHLQVKFIHNINIISAQCLLNYSPSKIIPASSEIENLMIIHEKDNHTENKDIFENTISPNMNQLISALIAEHTKCTQDYYNTDSKKQSLLTRTIEIWSELIEYRQIFLDNTQLLIKMTINEEHLLYSFNDLSDGEKAIFYYIAHILFTKKNSSIVIDEPENHLNSAICNKLWDKLESVRNDCSFIYLTHNIDFVMSRTNVTLLWNKSFNFPDTWDFEILSKNEIIPKSLIIELVGSTKKICFCEGNDKNSIDYKLYHILFPNYTIIPVGGHNAVINYTSAYNKSSIFSPKKAIGIIDGDCHLPEQKKIWESMDITILCTNEVENILCDELILDAAIKSFHASNDTKDKFMNSFWLELENNKEFQSLWYVNNYTNNKFKENFLKEKRDIEKLKEELAKITSSDEIQEKYDAHLQNLTDFINNKNYDEALRVVNFKGKLTKHIATVIVDKYPERILSMLNDDSPLVCQLISKYFPGFNY